jgi:hypothetical protein
MITSSLVDQTIHQISAKRVPFEMDKEQASKPLKIKRRKRLKPVNSLDGLIGEAVSILSKRLQASLLTHGHHNTSEIASLVSALSIARMAFPGAIEERVEDVRDDSVTHAPVPSESVVDYPINARLGRLDEVDAFRWRKDLEVLWKKHIIKDELHQPVVRSLGVPVMTIVNHIRDGSAWDTIRKLYPGLVMDDIRACASMATECGWLTDD